MRKRYLWPKKNSWTTYRQLLDILTRLLDQIGTITHHVKAGVIVSACLFLLLVLVAVWLFNTRSILQAYRAGDIKYRYIQLQAGKQLRPFLSTIDSLYHVHPQVFRDSVVQWEEERQRIAAMLREALKKEEDASQLRNRAGKIR